MSDLTGTLVPRDGSASSVADFAQEVTISGSALIAFDVELSSTSVDVPTLDLFSYAIFDSAVNPLPTSDPTGVAFLAAEFTTLSPTPAASGSSPGAVPEPPAPSFAPVAVVPQPGGLVLLGMGAAGSSRGQWRRATRRA